jgi:uncharacterized protein YbbC (DUF1343 family)
LQEQEFASLLGQRIGLVTHPAAVDRRLRHACEVLTAAPGVTLAALFGPEHGLLAESQDLVAVGEGDDPYTGLRSYSLYGETPESLRPTEEQLQGLDTLVIDLQDVGSRYYTFQATMLYCLEAAAQLDMRVVVLDRPNPLGGQSIEGPLLQPGFESFVGPHAILTRHGMTLGELGMLYNAERGLGVDLEVVACSDWQGDMDFEQTGLPWVMPSPNMPTVDTAFAYPGMCLLEGTNISEGRGTTRPFELFGAPWIDGRKLCRLLGEENLPGVAFRPAWFRPAFHKFAGHLCAGAQVHVLDRAVFQPVRTGLAVLTALRALSGEQFAWRTEPYEFVRDRPAIDLLFGSSRERLALEAGRPAREIARDWESEEEGFRQWRGDALLYPRNP